MRLITHSIAATGQCAHSARQHRGSTLHASASAPRKAGRHGCWPDGQRGPCKGSGTREGARLASLPNLCLIQAYKRPLTCLICQQLDITNFLECARTQAAIAPIIVSLNFEKELPGSFHTKDTVYNVIMSL
jgi:hypothetical protein